jgi:uncharacterized protein (TIGR03000 family)
MLQKTLSVSLVLILAGSGLNLAAGTGQAASRGGGHISGGFHGGSGGFHGGSGGFHGGSSGFHGGAHFGGSSAGFHSPGYNPGYRSSGRYGAYANSYTPHFYGAYGDWLNYGYAYPTYPNYSNPGDGYGAGAGASYEEPEQGEFQVLDNAASATSASSTSQHNGPAKILMTLPADATLWAQGVKISGSGSSRTLSSPTLAAGHRYGYDFRASWVENGHTVTQTQSVSVTAGARVKVHFPVKPANAHSAQSR